MAANIERLVDEFETVATAFTSVGAFRFMSFEEAVNADKNITPPIVVVEDAPEIVRLELTSGKIRYRVRFGFMDLYQTGERSTKDLQTKYGELETLARQYFRELHRRALEQRIADIGYPLLNEGRSGFFAYRAFNDSYARLYVEAEFLVTGDCINGTFNY